VSARGRIAVACVALGCAAGLVFASLAPARYRAQATMVVSVSGRPATASDSLAGRPLVPTVATLATSEIVVQNVAATLALSPAAVRSRLRWAPVGNTSVFRLTYDDRSSVRAVRIVEQASAVASSLVTAHFAAGSQRLTLAVEDPARSTRLGAKWPRDGLLGALAGVVAGLAALLAPRRGLASETTLESGIPPETAPADLLAHVRVALEARADEFDDAQVHRWESYLDELESQAARGALPPHLERLAAGFFAPLLKP
jgi:capsular polysaccharide biosynthesis protein